MSLRTIACLPFLLTLIACGVSSKPASPYLAHTTFSKTNLEIVAELPEPPGNVAVSADGRLFVSAHPMGGKKRKVFEVVPGAGIKEFLPESWSYPPVANSQVGISNIIALKALSKNTLWLLDMGEGQRLPRVIVWDLNTNSLKRVFNFPKEVVRSNSFFQDFAVDEKRQVLVVADMTLGTDCGCIHPALVVLDLKTGQAWRRLERHSSVMPENFPMIATGKELLLPRDNGCAAKPALGVNPIAFDSNRGNFIFGAMQGASLYSLSSKDAVDAKLSDGELAERIKKIGKKSLSDGIALDATGQVYSTDVVHGAIGRTDLKGEYDFYILEPERLIWPDGLAMGPGYWMYVTINQLHLLPALNAGKDETKPPFLLARFRVE